MSNVVVAYFSRRGENYVSGSIKNLLRGNAELIAEYAQRATNGDLFEIATMEAYPADYYACTDVAQAEKNANARPELTHTVDNMDTYDTIVLVYPNWWGTMPMAVYTFLESYDFTGKTILPCCTHEGSGMSNTERDIARTCAGTTVGKGLAITGSNAGDSQPAVERWLADLR